MPDAPHKPNAMKNPWGLTKTEVAVIDALIEAGNARLAAEKLGKSRRTVEFHLSNTVSKMGEGPRLLRILAWERWRRHHMEQIHDKTTD